MTKAENSAPSSPSSARLLVDLSEDLLSQGRSIRFRAYGRSMYPTIREGEAITVEPITPSGVRKGDIILYRSEAGIVAHRVTKVMEAGGELASTARVETEHSSANTRHPLSVARYSFFLRDDAWGTSRVKIEENQVLGKVIRVERDGLPVDPYSRKAQIRLMVHTIASWIRRRVSRS